VAAPSPLVRFARYGAAAFEFTGTIGAGAMVGWSIDRWLDSAPYGIMICTVLGAVGGFVRLIQILLQFDRVDRDAEH